MYTTESSTGAPTTHVLKSRPTLDPIFTSRSSQGTTFESDSSRQPSSIGHAPSSTGTDANSSAGWPLDANPVSEDNNNDTHTTNTVKLQRRTTKDLVKMFEQRSPATTSSSTNLVPASQPLRRGKSKNASNEPLPRLPRPHPLRESFRNLLTAFDKAKKTFRDQHPNVKFKRGRTSLDCPQILGEDSISGASGEGLSVPSQAKPTISRFVPSLSHDIRSGTLLYFDNDSTGPIWHRCEAFLAPPNLRISYFTTSGKSVSRLISVNGAVDARSIASTNCASIVPPMLDSSLPHVFELEFCGGATEKFATTSVLERGGWISAIWDVIVSPKGGTVMDKTGGSTESVLPLSLPAMSPDAGGGEPPREESEAEGLDRFDDDNKSVQAPIIGPVSPPIRTNTSDSVSNWSTTSAGSLTGSRSVRTLAGLSIVKQRLAQLDSFPSASGSNATLAYATPPRTPPPMEMKKVNESTLSRQATSSYTQHLPAQSLVHSPIPIRAPSMLSSGTSKDKGRSNDTDGSVYLPEVDEDEPPSSPKVQPVPVLRNLPRRESLPRTTRSMLSTRSSSSEGIHLKAQQEPNNSTLPNPTNVFQEAVEGLREDAKGHRTQLSKLVKQVSKMHNDVKLAVQQPPLPVPQLDDLKERLEALANGLDFVDLQGLHTKIDALKENTSEMTLKNEAPSRDADVADRLKGIEDAMKFIGSSQEAKDSGVPVILEKLREMQEQYEARDVPPPVPEKDDVPNPISALEAPLQELQQKLLGVETILVELKQYNEKRESAAPPPEPEASVQRSLSVFSGRGRDKAEVVVAGPSPEVLEILELVKEDQEHRTSIAEQFGDTVRYLNELNAWMEAFVTKTGGNEQILQKIAEAMDKIAQDPNATLLNLHNIGSSGSSDNGATLDNVQGLVSQARAQESVLQEVKTSIQSVLSAIQESARQQAEVKETQGINAILAILDRNRQEQDALLRNIAENLSSDIRGERIRFVDAMKDATTMNVTAHFEQFKRQLSKEVMVMLQDVGKLARSRERKHLEQEIAEIFNQQVVTVSKFQRLPRPLVSSLCPTLDLPVDRTLKDPTQSS